METVEHWLLENPWPLGGGLLLIGAVLFVHFARQGRQPGIRIALGFMAAGGCVFLLTWLITTPRQQVQQHTRSFLAATAPLELGVIADLLAPQAALTGPQGEHWLEQDDRLLQEAGAALERYPLQGHTIRSLDVQMLTRRLGTAEVDLRTQLMGQWSSLPIRSKWRFTWQRNEQNAWHLTEIQWLEFQGYAPHMGLWR